MSALRRSAALAAALLVATTANAKPLYLTVPRTFSTEEAPIIDLAFEGKAPVEIRVLQPRSVEGFLSAQANLRRAYSPARKEENPAAYFWKGLNGVKGPQGIFLDALDPEFRLGASSTFPPRTLLKKAANDGPLARFSDEPEVMISPPKDMEVVHREWLNLDLGGDNQDYTVPGFDSWFSSENIQERRLALKPLAAGIYVVQLVQGRVEGQVTLVVTDLSVQVRQTDDQVLVRVAGIDKRPRGNTQVTVRSAEQVLRTAQTDEKGEALLEGITEPRLLITAQANSDLAVVDTDFYSTLAMTPDVFLYTDRPIYKPGDTAHYKGILREPGSALQRIFFPSSRKVKVYLDRAGGTVSTPATATVDRYGSFSGKLKIPDDADPGVMRLRAVIDDRPHLSEARVQDYVKPTFYVELISEREGLTPGESIQAKARVRRYAGGTPVHARYEVFLYRTRVESAAWVDDAGLGAKGSAVTYTGTSTKEGAISVPELLYSSVEGRAGSEGFQYEDPWASAELFDENGEAALTIPVPALAASDADIAWKYSLVVRARDAEGSLASASKPFFLSDVEVLGQLSMSTKLVVPGASEEPMLAVRAVSLSGAAYPGATGSVSFKLEEAGGGVDEIGKNELSFGPDAVARIRIPSSKPGRLLAEVTIHDKRGKPWSGETSVLVAGGKGERVARVVALTAEALSTVVDVDDKARLVALLPDGWGPGGEDKGLVWFSLSGARIHESRTVEVTGNTLTHAFDVEERFGTAVHAQLAIPGRNGRWETQTVAFRIVPSRKVLKVEVQPVVLEALPMTDQTIQLRITDHRGQGVPASLSVSVVDKAVLAVQPEFRPSIIDFFYPLQRNNASDFFSADFQGYGYGEAIARRLLRRGFDFAAIKPPTKLHSKDERDTAYWNASVVTDDNGLATVTFKLPSNQTLWNVSVVAADASGRFGEGRGEFAARTGFSVAASLPQFLRAGDRARVIIRFSNTEKTPREGVQIDIDGSGALRAFEKNDAVTVAAGLEMLWPIDIVADKAGSARLGMRVRDKEIQRSDVREIPVQPGSVKDSLHASGWSGETLSLAVPAGAVVSRVTIAAMPGTVGAVLQNLRDLLTYPYGCVEQLVATTIPNVAVLKTLRTAGGVAQMDPAARALLEEAESRARQGVERILARALPAGGFGWFDGASHPSLPLTLIALDGLSYAVEAGLVEADEARIAASTRWLLSQNDPPTELAPMRVYVLARLTGAQAAPLVRQLLEGATTLDVYGAALAALAAEHAGIRAEPEVQQRFSDVVARVRDGVLVAWKPTNRHAFYELPMRPVGVTAIAAHATARAGQMDAGRETAVRKLLLTSLARRETLSTFDRSTLLLHSTWLLERDIRKMADVSPRVLVDGKAREVRFARSGGTLTGELGAGWVGMVTVDGFEGAVSLSADVDTPLAGLQPRSDGMKITRTYEVLRGGQRVPLTAGEKLVRGDEVFVRLDFGAHDDGHDGWRSAYYVIEDQVPAGFLPVQEDKIWRGAPYQLPLSSETMKERQFRPDRVTFFLQEPAWMRETRELGYVMRAQFTGTYSAGPATVRDMYAATVGARTGSAALEIVDAKLR